MKKKTVTLKDYIMAISIFLIALVVGIFIFYSGVQHSIAKNSQERISTNVSRQSEHLRTIFNINYQYLNEIAWQIGKSEPLISQNSIDRLEAIVEKTDLERVALIEPDGTAHYDNGVVKDLAYRRYFKEAMNFYRNFLSTVLKDNEYLERAILTGILRVAKESIFSGLNNLKVDSILKNQFNYFGLSEEEVLEALKYYKRDYEIQEVKEWYNGYTFGKNLVYNPWSIINFIDNDELTSFWVNTSTNDLIRNGLSNLSTINYKQFVKLINLEPIEIEIEENISFEMLDNPDVIWNLMLFSGYLTLNENKLVSFPNKEVRDFYITEFKRLAGYSINSFNSLLGYLMNKDIENFKGFLQEMFYTAVSYYDTDKEEKYYHNLMLGFVFGLSDNYEIRSNREYGTGRVDLLLKSKNNILPNYIFEFKVSKKMEDLESDCQKALDQIEEKKYGIEIENPVKIGMSFYGKEIEILSKE